MGAHRSWSGCSLSLSLSVDVLGCEVHGVEAPELRVVHAHVAHEPPPVEARPAGAAGAAVLPVLPPAHRAAEGDPPAAPAVHLLVVPSQGGAPAQEPRAQAAEDAGGTRHAVQLPVGGKVQLRRRRCKVAQPVLASLSLGGDTSGSQRWGGVDVWVDLRVSYH